MPSSVDMPATVAPSAHPNGIPTAPTRANWLMVVGTGIAARGQLTIEARSCVRDADVVLHVVTDTLTEQALHELNPRCESLRSCYADGKARAETYREMVDRIIEYLDAGATVCAVFYGHPGVFVTPSHEAVRRARERGHEARMLPAVSAEDCLFSDLGVDPARRGCQTYEATDFVLRPRVIDPTAALVLWQAGLVGHLDFRSRGYENRGIGELVQRLELTYQASHEVTVYEAAVLPLQLPRIERTRVGRLAAAGLRSISTLYVPPAGEPLVDRGVAARLGIELGLLASAPGLVGTA